MNRRITCSVVAAGVLAVFGIGRAEGAISSAGSGYWTNPAAWNPAQVPAGTDDVMICTGHTNTISTNIALAIASLTIQSNGVLTHAANGADALGERYKVVLNIASNLTIDIGGQINVDGMGYSANNGPGKPAVSYAGGSYGGKGGQRFSTPSSIGPTYGSIIAPTNLGSGGSIYSGGGCVQLTVAGTTTVNGVISALGAGGGNYEGGSGGSVFLTTGALTGNGTLRANGGSMLSGSSGGGGRVAVVLTNSTDFGAVKFQAYTGSGAGTTAGAGGTVYLEHTNHPAGQGKLIVDYNGIRAYLGNTVQNGIGASSNAFSEIVLTNAAVYELDTNDTLNIAGTTISGGSINRYEGIYVAGGTLTVPPAFVFSNYFILIGATNSTFLPTASLTVGTNATMAFDVPWTADYPITLEPGGWMSHSANSTDALGERYKLKLTINGNLNVQTGGAVNVDGMGYAANNGPGKPVVTWAGGSYGGRGSMEARGGIPGPTYGSITAPTNIGSGGSAAGGGCVRFIVTGTTTVNGAISASGVGGSYEGGSGGSVFLTTSALTGNGTIRANGGSTGFGSTGGGGRVAVIVTNSTDFGNVKIQAYAGGNATMGSAGTVYLETQPQAPGGGLLLIDAGNMASTLTTLISSNVTDTVVGTVVITNAAKLSVSNQVLTVQGDWDNKATFIGFLDGTVKFASTNPATITGHNTYYNLVCTNTDKVLSFEDGKTNTVNGTLTLAGVTLDSMSGSASWYLKASAFTHSVSNVTVGRSDARPGATIEAYDSTDQGGNFKWVFSESGFNTNIWTGTMDSDWNNTNNWSRKRSTILTDTVVIPTNGYNNYPVLDFHKRLLSLTIASNATMSLSGYDLTVDQTISVTGTLTAVGAATVTIGGNLDFTGGGVFNAASSTVRIVGSTAQSVVSAGNAFYQLTISNSAAPVVFADAVLASNIVNMATPVTFAGPVTVASAFRTQGTNVIFGGAVTATTFQNANGPLVFSGAMTAQAFNSANGALVFSGVVATVAFTNWQGDLTFGDDFSSREFSGAPGGMTFTFKGGKTYTIGNFDVYGRNGYPLVLHSSADGSAWNLNVTNWSKVRQVDVKDSNAQFGQTIVPVASTNSGGNTNWVFSGPWQTWVGSVSASFTNGNNWTPSGVPGEGVRLLVDGYYTTAPILSGVATAAQMIVGGYTTATVTVDGQLTTMENVEVQPSGTITHSPNSTDGLGERYKLKLTINGNLNVQIGGAVNVDGMGYAANNGPGKPVATWAGGSYGGRGSMEARGSGIPGPTYGSITAPTNLGSGGTSPGGGCVRLIVAGTTTVNGAVSASGVGGSYEGGSGGSVFLTTSALTGNGTIRANGGSTGFGSTGGGGRVAVIVTNSADFGNVKIQAYAGGSTLAWGSAGTVYLETQPQAPGGGLLLIDAGNMVSTLTTLISSQVTDIVVGTVVITNKAILALSNQTLTVRGDWVNRGVFVAFTNGTVDFAGANVATIWTNNTFFNFTCTNAGKILSFEAGRTNTVNGMLKLGSTTPGSTVTLRSTAEGNWSYLTLVPGGTQAIARVNVKDNNAGGGQKLLAGVGSANGGNNINWQFPPSGTMFMVR